VSAGIPIRRAHCIGRPIGLAPPHLRSYLDCVDGAVLLFRRKSWIGGRLWVYEKWDLYRCGAHVGRIEVPVPLVQSNDA
jgi:hypothetical protein